MLNLSLEEAVTVVNAFGELIERLDQENEQKKRFRDRDAFREEVLNNPDPLSLFQKRYDPSLLPFGKETIREALVLLISHPDVEEEMKSRLRVGLLSLNDFEGPSDPEGRNRLL